MEGYGDEELRKALAEYLKLEPKLLEAERLPSAYGSDLVVRAFPPMSMGEEAAAEIASKLGALGTDATLLSQVVGALSRAVFCSCLYTVFLPQHGNPASTPLIIPQPTRSFHASTRSFHVSTTQ